MAAGLPLMTVASMAPKPLEFERWIVDGAAQPFGQRSITVTASAPVTAVANYALQIPAADFDANGTMDGFDFLAWQRGFGTTPPTAIKSDGDADDDGDVDHVDLAAWENQYGGVTSPLAAMAGSPLAAQAGVAGVAELPVATFSSSFIGLSDFDTRPSLDLPAKDAVFARRLSDGEDDMREESLHNVLLEFVLAQSDIEMLTSRPDDNYEIYDDGETTADEFEKLDEIVFQTLSAEYKMSIR